ncbi:MAG: dCTP deaminase [Bacilli bacterium]
MLSNDEILKNIENGNIVIKPFNKENLKPNSYSVHMTDEIIVYKNKTLDSRKVNEYETLTIPKEGFTLMPGEVYLARTVEYTETRSFVPLLHGRLSLATLGICIHITAGFGDNGFCGTWTLEITCARPVRIYKNMKIGQICYIPIIGNQSIYYNGKYQNQINTKTSMMHKDFE